MGKVSKDKQMWRPTKKNEHIVKLLEEAFKIDSTVTEACLYAWISRETYYTWLEEDGDFSDRMDKAKTFPFMLARNTLFNAVNAGDSKAAVEFLKRRDNRYKDKVESEEKPIDEWVTEEQKEVMDKFRDEYQSKV